MFFAISTNVYSQSSSIDYKQQLKMPTVLPASPEAAAIEKFGNIPISYATGVPDISIPLYTVKCGQINWPVSLSYHAGGIRVDEIASSAGLGWSVNAPGVISRAVVGRPDEEFDNEPTYSSAGSSDWFYLYLAADGKYDSEYDIFSFNFNGRSGKFIVRQDGSILQIPLSNLKITASTSLGSFTITDENGVNYFFDQTEWTTSHNIAVLESDIEYISSWYLSKIELPDKNNTIQFTYGSAGSSGQLFKNYHQAIGQKYNSTSLYEQYVSGNQSIINFLKVASITFPNGSIVFTYDPTVRQDFEIYNKLSAITINRVTNNVATQIKKFSFKQSYFYNNTAYAPGPQNPYRLKLDSLEEYGNSSTINPKKYKFQYNPTLMVPRGNYGQDIWGFNNGQSGNHTLLQSQTVYFNNESGYASTYTFGDANRNVDEEQMKACMLSSITYPTGGTTTFSFEPHVYDAEEVTTTPDGKGTKVSADQGQLSTTTFTFPSTAQPNEPPRVIVSISRCDYAGVDQRSRVSLTDLTTGYEIYSQVNMNPSQVLELNDPIWLVQGHNYELKANVYTSAALSAVTAAINVQWNNFTGQQDIKKGGGLRIKEIKNYTRNGVLAGTETFVYDTAVTLTPFYHIKRTYSEVFYRFGNNPTGGLSCVYTYSPLCRIYTSGSIYPLTTAMGSPMLYKRVQKITTDSATGAVNGKSEYQYDVFRDETYPVGDRYFIPPLLSNDWKNGFLVSETQYKINNGVYSIVKKTEKKYSEYNSTEATALKVQNRYIKEGCSPFYESSLYGEIEFPTYPIRSGSKRLWEQIETVYGVNQNKIETHTYNDYVNNKYDFPTKTTVIDSKKSTRSIEFKYAPDFSAAGNVYEKMEQRNIIAPVIEQKFYNNTTLLNTTKNNYLDWYGDGKILALNEIQTSVLNNTLETRLKYYGYDTYNNPVLVGKNDDVQVSYIWGYKNSYPIAEVTNSDNTSIANTSFEEDAAGGWTIGSTVRSADCITGKQGYDMGNGNVTKGSLTTTKTYIVSLWAKPGAAALVNSASFGVALFQRNGWNYYEKKITPSTGTITISGTGIIDELRLYPEGSQMKTSTYDPLTGVRSECDLNNRITYYEYDAFNRLNLLRDQDKNIIKKFSYSYAGQSVNSDVTTPTPGSTLMSVSYTNVTSASMSLQLVNKATQATYDFTLSANRTTGTIALQAGKSASESKIPEGIYDAYFSSSNTSGTYEYEAYNNYISGLNTAQFYNITLCSSCGQVSIAY
ncbi:MAG: hypothetical protein JWQ09_4542 [Segetibacter sp.]|nr:hypothetical protein [Segetibacter sp.]